MNEPLFVCTDGAINTRTSAEEATVGRRHERAETMTGDQNATALLSEKL